MDWPQALSALLPVGAVLESCTSLALEPLPRSVGMARRFVREHAPQLDGDVLDTLLLLTSELATNAVVHARTPMVVGLGCSAQHLVVGVHDQDLGRREQGGADRDGGRGLALVAELAGASGQVRHPEGGKTCWFRIGREGGA